LAILNIFCSRFAMVRKRFHPGVSSKFTWKILTDDSQKIIYCSLVRPYSKDDPNFRADMGRNLVSLVTPLLNRNAIILPIWPVTTS
jgi:hypothetical protein